MIGYAKYLESNNTMSFKLIDKKTDKKVYRNMEKITSLMNIEFESL